MTLNIILALALKDGRLFLADRRAALLSFLVPILLASAFGLVFDRPTSAQHEPHLPMVVIHPGPDAGPLTLKVLAALQNSDRAEVIVLPKDQALARVAERCPGVAVEFPVQFETLAQCMTDGTKVKPNVTLIHHALSISEAHWAEGVVTEATMKTLAISTLGVPTATPFTMSLTTVPGSGNFNSYSHSFSGMTLQYLLFWGMESGLLFLRDRSRGVWRRVRTAPVSLTTIVLAKVLATATIALAQLSVVFAFGWVAFGVTIGGSVVGFIALACAVSLLAAATGLLVAAWGGTEARARAVSILVILGVSMLGGLWLPSFLLPTWARDLALALPTTWAMQGLDAVTWQGRGLLAVLPAACIVLGFALVFLMAAAARLGQQEARHRRGLVC